MESKTTLHFVPDDELLRRLGELVSHSRRVEVDLVSHIGEVEERRLYAREAFPSMFAYCTGALHLSEAEAYLRITVARAAREHPLLLTMLGDGRLHLSGIVKLLPILTRENRDWLLERATHRSKRQIVELVAELSPRPDVPSLMRKLPQGEPSRRRRPPRPDPDRASCFELGPDGVDGLPDTDGHREPGPRRCRVSRTRSGPSWSFCWADGSPWSCLEPRPSAGAATTRGRGASVARPLQGPVHRQRGAPRQARAAGGPDAGRGARRRSGRDHRSGRHREARADRGQALRQTKRSPQGAR